MFEKDSPNDRYLWRLQPTSTNLEELRESYRDQNLFSEVDLRDLRDRYSEEKDLLRRRFPELASGTYGPGHPQQFRLDTCNIHISLIEKELKARAGSPRLPKIREGDKNKAAERQAFMAPYLEKRTVSAIATLSGLECSSLYRWHKGQSRLSTENRNKLATFLKTELEQVPN